MKQPVRKYADTFSAVTVLKEMFPFLAARMVRLEETAAKEKEQIVARDTR